MTCVFELTAFTLKILKIFKLFHLPALKSSIAEASSFVEFRFPSGAGSDWIM